MATPPTISPFPLGKLTTAPNTPIRLTANYPSLYGNWTIDGGISRDLWANSMELIADLSNQGNIYIGTQTMNKATLVGVIRVIRPGESWVLENNIGGATYHVGDYFMDQDVANDFIHGWARLAP